MNQKKKIIILIILLSLIILSIIISSNPRLVDRALYRIGVQEQVCFSDPKIDQNQNEKNFVFVGDFGINRNSLNTLNNMKLVNPEMIILTGGSPIGRFSCSAKFSLVQFHLAQKPH